ncbi:MAG: hypothetical protein J0J10_09500 [Bosea sp.]|uniref:hypothetical protein n=1 Tax=Bosea sp. (in: a-proteobacteria) TaxID=1871050 RepID=UPI001AC61A61|nr:hypothetical protein [Bosea sp. (in: a-proteobacteria)]MBN9468993.1 hypothetical protein [Bosea sp. (in: a-proteobacteria)]
MTAPSAEKTAETRAYWTHKVDSFPGPVAQFRMAQLIDLDDRLYENARVVYRFLIGWYHDGHGDALLSMRHVSKVMRARAPDGVAVLSHSVVQRAVSALLDTGWVVRTHKGRGKGKGASRFMPVLNVLELAGQGKFPEPSHSGGTVECSAELSRSNGTVVSRSNGTVEPELSRSNGPKTLLLDPVIEPGTGNSNDVAGPHAAGCLAAPAAAGFEKVWLAYGKHGNKAAARAEFAKLANPDVDHIADRAASWAASARPGQKRMPLEKWLAEEKYDEADRRVEPKPERTAKPAKAANSNRPANIKGGVTSLPKGEHLVEVIGYTDGDPWAAQAAVKLSLRAEEAAAPFVHECYFAHPDDDEESAGRKSLHTLISATGGSSANDNNPNPVGCWVWAVVSDVVSYRAALAPTSAQGAPRNGATP